MTRHCKESRSYERCKKSNYDFRKLLVKKLKVCKGKFCKLISDKVIAEQIFLEGENIVEKFENFGEVVRDEFEFKTGFFPSNAEEVETETEEFQLVLPVVRIEDQRYQSLNEVITNVVIENKEPSVIQTALFRAVVMYSPSNEDSVYAYNISTNTFDEIIGPNLAPYLFFEDDRIEPSKRTVNFAETVKFTNTEMQKFISTQQEIGTPMPDGSDTVLFMIDTDLTLTAGSPLDLIQSKKCTSTYAFPKE